MIRYMGEPQSPQRILLAASVTTGYVEGLDGDRGAQPDGPVDLARSMAGIQVGDFRTPGVRC
jgi:hypothetical protein